VDQFARRCFVTIEARIADPVGQAIAAESRQSHQLDILRVMAMLKVAHQPAKGRSRYCVVQMIKRV
jgi:hypothetical protein